MKCYDKNCYAKPRVPSLEIENCDLHKTTSVQCLHFTNNVVWIRMLDGQEGRCTANRCTGSVVPLKDVRCTLAWLHQEWCSTSNDSTTLSSVVKSRRLSLFGHVAWMNELADANWILFAQPPDNWEAQGGHAPPGFEMFAMTCPHLAWSCQKSAQNQPFWRMLMKHYRYTPILVHAHTGLDTLADDIWHIQIKEKMLEFSMVLSTPCLNHMLTITKHHNKTNINVQSTYTEVCWIFSVGYVHRLARPDVDMFDLNSVVTLLHSAHKQYRITI